MRSPAPASGALNLVGHDTAGRVELLTIARRLRRKLKEYRYRPKVIYPHGDRLKGTFTVGEGTVLGINSRIDCTGHVEIGRHCILSDGVRIFSHTHDFLYGDVPDITGVTGISQSRVKICDNVYIGGEAVILPQVSEIGESAIIGARAVVTKPVGPGEIWVGNPARKVGSRSDASPGNDVPPAF